MEQKYNIIGDIHGRTCWKELIVENAINIFVGDYFSPYEDISFDKQQENFLEIIDFKTKHPETILLIGNHDNQHWKNINPRISRFDYANYQVIKEMFEEFSDYFQVSYSIENKVLVTHAGVTINWYVNQLTNAFVTHVIDLTAEEAQGCTNIETAFNQYHEYLKEKGFYEEPINGQVYLFKKNYYFIDEGLIRKMGHTPDVISEKINQIWKDGKYKQFTFNEGASTFSDNYGTSPTHGPMWIRPYTLADYNIFSDNSEFHQVFGHTMTKTVDTFNKLHMVDCLQFSVESLLVEVEEEKLNFSVNHGKEKTTNGN